MEYYDYVELYNTIPVIMTPDEEFLDWALEHCPEPTEQELQEQYREIEEDQKC